MFMITTDDHQHLSDALSSSSLSSSLCPHENCTKEHSTSNSENAFPNSFIIIFILSILCFFGVCFMIFGPLQRSEAYKRVENFTFGRDPIFNVDHRKPSTSTRCEESTELPSI